MDNNRFQQAHKKAQAINRLCLLCLQMNLTSAD